MGRVLKTKVKAVKFSSYKNYKGKPAIIGRCYTCEGYERGVDCDCLNKMVHKHKKCPLVD